MGRLQEILQRTRALTFDCYGTLIDWKTGLADSFRGLFGFLSDEQTGRLFQDYVRVEAEMESRPYHSYREILQEVAMALGQKQKTPFSADQAKAFAQSMTTWKPFADSVAALQKLKQRYRLGVLSNVDRDLFAETRKQLGVDFDFVITAEDVQSYKPDHGHFERLFETQGDREQIVHVAQSLYHDGRPANALGLGFVWINRYNEKNDELGVRKLGEFPDLMSFAEAACA